ncbi:hypothetical protein [Streptomyces sp. NPDC047024]|uniref:hypothetical protein n=1 Tax=Streptomyces sp. NPDC047024 TaxID=3155476 RepID=UPI0033DDE63D
MPEAGRHEPRSATVITQPIPPLAPSFEWDDFEIPAHACGGRVTLSLYDELSKFAPPAARRPRACSRISSGHFGLEAGVDRQQEDAEDTRRRLAWAPFAKIYRENDT